MSSESEVINLMTTRPEAEIAADLKRRFEEAIRPALEIIDEANRQGLWIRFDNIAAMPPFMKNKVNNLRVERHY